MLARLLVVLLLAVMARTALADSAIPPRTGQLVDQAHVLSADEHSALEDKLSQSKQASIQSRQAPINVLIVRRIGKESIERFAERVAAAWQLGESEALLVASIADRRMRIEVGRSLAGQLDEQLRQQVLTQELAPAFKQRSYFLGLDRALDKLLPALMPPPPVPKVVARPVPPPTPAAHVEPRREELYPKLGSTYAWLLVGMLFLGWTIYLAIADEHRLLPVMAALGISALSFVGLLWVMNVSLLWTATLAFAAGSFATFFGALVPHIHRETWDEYLERTSRQ